MREELAHYCALADSLNHPRKRLLTRRHLGVLPLALPLVLRDPLLDLNREDVIVELRLQRSEALAQPVEDVGSERNRLPVGALPEDPNPSTDLLDVDPPNAKHFRATQPSALHKQDRRELMRARSGPNPVEFVTLGRYMSARRFLGRRSGAEGSTSTRTSASPSRRTSAAPIPRSPASPRTCPPTVSGTRAILLREPREIEFRVVLRKLEEDPTVRVDGAWSRVPLEAAPVEISVDGTLDPHFGASSG